MLSSLPTTSETTFLFVRHGETGDNLKGLMHWQKDIHLNATGKIQAKELAKAINDHHKKSFNDQITDWMLC